MEKIIELAIKELKERLAEDGEEMSEEDVRLTVYEDLRDHLKYLMADVAYGI